MKDNKGGLVAGTKDLTNRLISYTDALQVICPTLVTSNDFKYLLKYFATTTDKNTDIDDTHYSKLQRNRCIALYGIFQCLLRCVPKGVFPHDLMVAYWRATDDYRKEKQRLGHSASPAVFFKAVIETPNTILRVLNAYGEGIELCTMHSLCEGSCSLRSSPNSWPIRRTAILSG